MSQANDKPDRSRSERICGIELMRFVAAILIVFWHIPGMQSGSMVTWSLSFFVLTSLMFMRPRKRETQSRMIRRMSKRLLVPWVIWSLFYIVGHLAMAGFSWNAFVDGLSWRNLLYGGSIPLWYLPFIWVVGCISGSLVLYSTRKAGSVATGIVRLVQAVGPFLAILFIPLIPLLADGGIPLAQWGSVLPAIGFGFYFARRRAVQRLGASQVAWLVLGLISCVIVYRAMDLEFMPTLISVCLLIACLFSPLQRGGVLLHLGTLSWPIYLVHSAFMGVLGGLFGFTGLTLFFLVLAGSVIVSEVLVNIRLFKEWLL